MYIFRLVVEYYKLSLLLVVFLLRVPAFHKVFPYDITIIREPVNKLSHAINRVFPRPPLAYTVVAAPSIVEVLAVSIYKTG